jgi:uncharacterized membrane protein YdcZ (DUF606 family)
VKIFFLMLAVLAGFAGGTQPLLNGALSRTKGVPEAVYVSVSVTFVAIVLILAAKSMRMSETGLAFSGWSAALLAVAAVLAALALALVTHGVAPWYFTSGLLGLVVLFGATAATPVLGAGTTIAAVVLGQLLAGLLWDQIGVLGLSQIAISPQRLAGVALVVCGVVLVRGL